MMESTLYFIDEIPQTLESDESSNVINFTRDNIEYMMNTRYRELKKGVLQWNVLFNRKKDYQ